MKFISLAAILWSKNRLPVWRFGGIILVCIAICAVSLRFWAGDKTAVAEASTGELADPNQPIQAIQSFTNLNPEKVALGRQLFQDVRLSHNSQVSCASCHNLAAGGADYKARSIGINGSVGVINAPTVFNSRLNFVQFWDGRAATLESQIDGPIQSPIEMGSTWTEIVGKLRSSPEYVQSFYQVYGDTIQGDRVKDSIAEFERSLTTPNSRFDRYLRHDASAITSRELQGYNLFRSLGCSSCHQGMNIGGNMYQKLGILAPYFTDRGHIEIADGGRFNITGSPEDLYVFKVPSLRNVDRTAPYFHDGSQATLSDAVRAMAKYQLGRNLNVMELELIVEFLKTLTGEFNGQLL